MDYLPLSDEDVAPRNCRKARCSGKYLEPLLWAVAISLTLFLIFQPVNVQESTAAATNMNAMVAPSTHSMTVALNSNSHIPTETANARAVALDGCFKLSREECCSYRDGREDHWGGWDCMPAAKGETFISGNVCEPELAAVGPLGSCDVADTKGNAASYVDEAQLAKELMAEQKERDAHTDSNEERLLKAEQSMRAENFHGAEGAAPKVEEAKEEPKLDLKAELKLGAKLKAEQGGRLFGLGCALRTKMNQTCSLPEEAKAESGTPCGTDCLKECNTVAPGHEAYCVSSCASYCVDTGCSLSKEKIEKKVGETEDMQVYFGSLEGSATCKAVKSKELPPAPEGRDDLKPAKEGCFTLSREDCCGHKDGRDDQWGNYECVPAAAGKTFFTGNVCEPALAAVGPVGTCAVAAPAATPAASKITLKAGAK
jgi:hypothetical protein